MTGLTDATVRVRVPASSANLGPGFDSLGLALSLYDEVTARAVEGPTRVTVQGEGAEWLPQDSSHLVVSSLETTLRRCGVTPPGLEVHCRNAIPQARGLGSSSAAIVAGILAARRLLLDDILDDDSSLRLASDIEGHPDNVAPCLLGGFTIAWTSENGAQAVRSQPAPGLNPVVYIPQQQGLTQQARAALPDRVPHADAAFNLSRAALAVLAFTRDPELLLDATADRLHQPYRAVDAPATSELVARLRSADIPAMVSGAGPSVLAFSDSPPHVDGFELRALAVSEGAAGVA